MIVFQGAKANSSRKQNHQPLKVFHAVIESMYGAESELIAALGRLEALLISICRDEKHVMSSSNGAVSFLLSAQRYARIIAQALSITWISKKKALSITRLKFS